jgi:hypothetical protein
VDGAALDGAAAAGAVRAGADRRPSAPTWSGSCRSKLVVGLGLGRPLCAFQTGRIPLGLARRACESLLEGGEPAFPEASIICRNETAPASRA